jgi:hypothetical protein
MTIDYISQVTKSLEKMQAADNNGNVDLAIAHTRQLLSYFYMYLRELELRKLEEK